jgi:hypothetical protein
VQSPRYGNAPYTMLLSVLAYDHNITPAAARSHCPPYWLHVVVCIHEDQNIRILVHVHYHVRTALKVPRVQQCCGSEHSFMGRCFKRKATKRKVSNDMLP